MYTIRPCRKAERPIISEIVNAAAEAYRGVIPADRWHDPYMNLQELDSEISAGVAFWAYESEREVIGVMTIRPNQHDAQLRYADVAAATGFADQAHLTRVFKRIHGTPPGALRKPAALQSKS